MPDITLSSKTFEQLQRHAKPLVDTPESVIIRALNALEQNTVQPASGTLGVINTPTERQVDPNNLPSLTHAKLLHASVAGKRLVKPNWNSLLHELLKIAMARAENFEEVQNICPITMVKGEQTDHGYYHLQVEDLEISVQGQDSNSGCQAAVTAAQSLNVDLDISFFWRVKDGAAYPGERGRISIKQEIL